MSDCKKEGSDLTLLWVAMFYVGMFIFLYSFIGQRATRWSTKLLGWFSVLLILAGGTMMVYDHSSPRRGRTISNLESVKVKVHTANLRSSATSRKRDNIVGKVPRGTELKAIYQTGKWIMVSHDQGTAYIHRGIVKKNYTYATIDSGLRWPGLKGAMILFSILYILSVISAFREQRRFYSELGC